MDVCGTGRNMITSLQKGLGWALALNEMFVRSTKPCREEDGEQT